METRAATRSRSHPGRRVNAEEMSTTVEDVKGPDEIVPSDVSGGANTSHTIVVPALTTLLAHVPPGADQEAYERAALIDNVLGKETDGARKRTFRYLRELYLLRSDSVLFRALRSLWDDDPEARPLLAGLSALARDASFRASAAAIVSSSPGGRLRSADLAAAVESVFPESYSDSTLAKVGRNAFSSWEQTGHLRPADRTEKVRVRAVCRPPNLAYAFLLGYLEGHRGEALFDTLWAKVLDVPRSHLFELAFAASQRGFLDFRNAGGVVEVGFRDLLRPIEGKLT